MQHLGIEIEKKRDKILSEQSFKLLKDYYCRDDEKTPQMAFARAAVAFSAGNLGLAQRIYDYVSKGWFMYSSPVLSNAHNVNNDDRIEIVNLTYKINK